MLLKLMKRLSPRFQMFAGIQELRKGNAIVQAVEYERLKAKMQGDAPYNLAIEGYKVYSQTDEDGIIDAIFKKVTHNQSFVEIGVQTGVECNTLTLLLRDWRGVWVEGDGQAVDAIGKSLGGTRFPGRFEVRNTFVDAGKIVSIVKEAREFIGVEELDFLSIDVDGVDVYLLDSLLSSGEQPKVICVEYNGKFPLPISVKPIYKPDHVWDHVSDFMGSSLQALLDMFTVHRYVLLTCNIPGINAFFIREDVMSSFNILDPETLFQPFRIYLSPIQAPQAPSLGFLKAKFDAENVHPA